MERASAKPRRRLALAQYAPALGDLKANLDLQLELTQQAISEGADMVAFPELSLTGYLLKDLVPEVAMTLGDDRLHPLLELSRKIDIATGAVLKSDDFRHYNVAMYLSGGEVAHVHRKVYLPTYGMFDEQRYFAPGDRIRAFEIAGLRTGMLVCEDMWHLSTAYLLFVQGVSLLLCISSSPGRGVLAGADRDAVPGSVGSWNDLIRTVAEYTTSYVAYVNRLGYEDGVNFWGGSCVYGPDGRAVLEAGENTGLAIAEIDIREVERQRLATPLLRDEKAEFTLRELERVWNERTDSPY